MENMANNIFHIPLLMLAGVFLSTLIIGIVVAALFFDIYRRRIPRAAFAENIEERIAGSREELADLEHQKSLARQTLGDLDKNKAEAEFWSGHVAQLKQEYEELGDRRAELERFREEMRKEMEEAAINREKNSEMKGNSQTSSTFVTMHKERSISWKQQQKSRKPNLRPPHWNLNAHDLNTKCTSFLHEAEETKQLHKQRTDEINDIESRLKKMKSEIEKTTHEETDPRQKNCT